MQLQVAEGEDLTIVCPLSPILFVLFMDQAVSSLGLDWDLDFQQALVWFVFECEVVRTRFRTSRSKATLLRQETVDCPFQTGVGYKYLTSDRTMESEMDKQFAVLQTFLADCCGEEGTKQECTGLDLPVNLHSNPHLWS